MMGSTSVQGSSHLIFCDNSFLFLNDALICVDTPFPHVGRHIQLHLDVVSTCEFAADGK